MAYLFGYGSLVDPASVESTLGRRLEPSDGPHPAKLPGYRRSWNVADHTSTLLGYSFTHEGLPWEGWVVWLGLETDAGSEAVGALVRVTDDDLAKLDMRESSYARVLVTVPPDPSVPDLGSTGVYAYVPSAEVQVQAAELGASGVVMSRYLRLVDGAFRQLGPEAYTQHCESLPPCAPFVVREIVVAPNS